MAGEIKNLQIVLGFVNMMILMEMKVTRASLSRFRNERFSKNISRNKFYQAMRLSIARGYLVEGEQVGKALTLQLSATGRLVMSSPTVVEATHHIVSQQSAPTCVAHATAKAATWLLRQMGWRADFNQVLVGFLNKMTLRQMQNGVSLNFFHKKKIMVKFVGTTAEQTNGRMILELENVDLEDGKERGAIMIMGVYAGEWLRIQSEEAPQQDGWHAMALSGTFHDGSVMGSNSWGEGHEVEVPESEINELLEVDLVDLDWI